MLGKWLRPKKTSTSAQVASSCASRDMNVAKDKSEGLPKKAFGSKRSTSPHAGRNRTGSSKQPAFSKAPKSPSSSRSQRPRRKSSHPRGSKQDCPIPQSDQHNLEQRLQGHAEWSLDDYQIDEKKDHVRFVDLDLKAPILHAVQQLGYQYCTPIQARTLPATLMGKDAVGKAQTGTGKTAAFLITAIQYLLEHPEPLAYASEPRVLVLAPTRELAMQIAKDAKALSQFVDMNIMTVIGGADYEKQKNHLQRERVDILVATPGRLIDFLQQQVVFLDQVEILVIDEADRMLDMGFMPDVRRIVRATPPVAVRQTLFFSATFSYEILMLTERWLQDPVRIEIEPEQVAADVIEQAFYWVSEHQKANITRKILEAVPFERVIIFANRRDVCRRLHEKLKLLGCSNVLLSGEIHQSKRLKTLERFKRGECKVMVATDVAGRGIHIDDVSLVINYELPEEPEDYVHRIGRTGRAGAMGKSISLVDENGGFSVPALSRYLGHELALAPLPLEYEVR